MYAEAGARIERLRRYVASTTFSNASSLWCFAGALVLPIGLAGILTVCLYAQDLWRIRREHSGRPFQLMYTGATEILATMTAASVLSDAGAGSGAFADTATGALAVLAGAIVYMAVNQSLVTTVVYLVTRPARLRDVAVGRDDELLEISTLALAVLLAVAVVFAPFLSPAALLVIALLRRSTLVRELQVQATHDSKTGLLNAGAWRAEAEREFSRAERIGSTISILMVDLDHFKVLNDTFGHPAGDATLKAVADCLTEALRDYDAVARFGGEEFIALLAGSDSLRAERVAARLCGRIRSLELAHNGTVTASIGVGTGRVGDIDLDDLIALSDTALYAAKHGGRDRVVAMRHGTSITLRQPRD